MGDYLPPVDLGTGRTAIAVATGSQTNCIVLDNGMVKCFGNTADGCAGQPDTVLATIGVTDSNIGDDDFELGDKLPAISLGTDRVDEIWRLTRRPMKREPLLHAFLTN